MVTAMVVRVANNTDYREVEYEAGVGALVLLRNARDS